MAVLRQIKTYPIKGLIGRDLETADLLLGKGIAEDRKFALTIEDGIDGSTWVSSRSFLINAVNDGLLKIASQWSGSQLTLMCPDGHSVSLDVENHHGLHALNQKLPALLSDIVDSAVRPRLVECARTMVPSAFWDYPDSQLSVMNMESLRVLSHALDVDLDMARFRGNLIVDDLPAWSEFGLAGWRYQLGGAEIEFTRPVRRCAATAVNPKTGIRDVAVHSQLVEHFGHGYFGIYARVTRAGKILPGDRLIRLGKAELEPTDAQVQGAGPYALWPKLAMLNELEVSSAGAKIVLEPKGAWALVERDGQEQGQEQGQMKLHLGQHNTIRAKLDHRSSRSTLAIELKVDASDLGNLSFPRMVVVTGPFGR